MTEDSRYEAVRGRDGRFDGEFFFAVATTGIYCRPSCPAITPKRANVTFFPTAAAAQGAGYRACRRCRPDAVPGSAEWNARADVVGRAVRLISDGVVDREGVAGLAARLGYSVRQVRRQLNAELGAGPIALARAQRAHTARVLLQTTRLPAADIAFAAGFASVRQFNDTIRQVYAATPSGLRAAPGGARATTRSRGGSPAPAAPTVPATPTTPATPATGTKAGVAGAAEVAGAAGVPLRLAFRGPYAAGELFDHLQRRALAGVEEVTGARGDRVYRRTLRLPHGTGVAEVRERLGAGWLDCRLHLSELRDLTTAGQRLRRLFDLDADPYAVAERLGADPALADAVRARPGLRAPGTPDPHELAVRAVLGQGVSPDTGRRLGDALVAAYGEPLAAPSGGLTRLFPTVAVLAEAPLTALGGSRERWAAVRTVCAALADGTVQLDPGVDRDQAERDLLALPGVAPGTAARIRMRALGDPDVLPADDPALRAALVRAGRTVADAERWRPWRTYAGHHLLLRDADLAGPGHGPGAAAYAHTSS